MPYKRKRPLPSLERRPPRVLPKIVFWLLCEGQNTEPHYFEALKSVYKEALIEFNILPAVGVPMTICEKSIKEAKRLGLLATRGSRKDSFEKRDEVWAIFDRDKHPNFEQAIRKCQAAGIQVARSNPCFEVWLILHKTEYDKDEDHHKTQKYLEFIMPEYCSKGSKTMNFISLMGSLSSAEAKAERQLKKREEEGNAYGAPSTSVFLLTKRIRECASQTAF